MSFVWKDSWHSPFSDLVVSKVALAYKEDECKPLCNTTFVRIAHVSTFRATRKDCSTRTITVAFG